LHSFSNEIRSFPLGKYPPRLPNTISGLHSFCGEFFRSRTSPFSFDVSADKEAQRKRDQNLRDVLIHLYEWHMLLINWVKANQSGDDKPFLPTPYNRKNYGDMNVAFWKKTSSHSL
jgi:hypothetical protein